jgi:hypothetical protein
MMAVIATLLNKFSFTPIDKFVVVPDPKNTLIPRNLFMRAEENTGNIYKGIAKNIHTTKSECPFL